jgi:hypothetical protein
VKTPAGIATKDYGYSQRKPISLDRVVPWDRLEKKGEKIVKLFVESNKCLKKQIYLLDVAKVTARVSIYPRTKSIFPN